MQASQNVLKTNTDVAAIFVEKGGLQLLVSILD